MNIVSTIVDAITEFVSGIGSAFVDAFQSVFMVATETDGVVTYSGINNLGQFLLILFGISLGYGVIRYITGLFRREA